MPRRKDPVRVAVGRLGYYSRADQTDPEKIANAERDVRAARIERAIQKAVEKAPPLTTEQRDRLMTLLGGVSE